MLLWADLVWEISDDRLHSVFFICIRMKTDKFWPMEFCTRIFSAFAKPTHFIWFSLSDENELFSKILFTSKFTKIKEEKHAILRILLSVDYIIILRLCLWSFVCLYFGLFIDFFPCRIQKMIFLLFTYSSTLRELYFIWIIFLLQYFYSLIWMYQIISHIFLFYFTECQKYKINWAFVFFFTSF